MCIIFYLSSRTAVESSEQSSVIVDFLTRIFGKGVTDFIVRKSAHFLEFAGLCFLYCIALYQSNKRNLLMHAIVFTSAYAGLDEIHQIFVAGRSCELRDWAIDTLGAVAGAIGYIVLFKVFMAIKLKRCKTH